jgi:hypothetical protein
VTDEDKENHPHDTGITTYSCGWAATQSKVEVTSRSKKRVCLRTTQLLVKFEGSPKVTVATWKPPKRLSAACECEKTNYNEAVIEHERWHVNDIKEVETNHTEAWNNNQPEFKACGYGKFAKKNAKEALKKKIRKRARKECLRINADINRRARKYDATHQLSPMDCSFCRPGQKASQKASDSKCVDDPCGGRCGGKYPTCCATEEWNICANLETGFDQVGHGVVHCGQCVNGRCHFGETCDNGQCCGHGGDPASCQPPF